MNNSTNSLLAQHFSLAIEAPDGIQRLREIILTLGMQGKLVPQDPQDEPASELLKKIKAEKRRLVKEGKIKEPKPLPEIKPEEIPYQVPNGWEWVRIRSIGYDWGQKEPDCSFTYIDVGSIDNSVGKIVSPQTLSPEEAPSRARKSVKQGTVIYSTVRPYLLNMAIVGSHSPEPIASTAFAVIHPHSRVLETFIFYFLKSPTFTKYVSLVMKGVAYPAINDSDFFLAVFPLPPHAEQKRIVAKIDELMKHCDDLEKLKEALSKKKEETHRAANAELLEAPDARSTSKAFSFIHKRFNEFYDSKEYVEELKKTILQLAVMGRLVPQDANDEPASVLLKKIEAEKKRLVKEGKIKEPKQLPVIKSEEEPFQVPNGWEWCYWNNMTEWMTYGFTRPMTHVDKGIPIITAKNIYNNQIHFDSADHTTFNEYEALSEKDKPLNADILITKDGSIGRAAIVQNNIPFCISQSVAVLWMRHKPVSREYLLLVINSPYLQERIFSASAGAAIKHISITDFIRFLLPLPPLAEQNRIAAKVDQLMTLCDKLSSSIDASREKQKMLLEAIMQRM
jgi:type I restriction enzyme S subunit